MVGATASALLSMVAELSDGRPKFEVYAATIRRSAAIGRRIGEELLRLADQDAMAFGAFMATWKGSKELATDQRSAVLADAGRWSAEAPRQMLGCCVVIAEACERLAGRSNPSLASDLVCATRAVEAAAHCAAENVFVNLPNLSDETEQEALRTGAVQMVADTERHARAARRVIAAGGLRAPERHKAASTDDSRSSE